MADERFVNPASEVPIADFIRAWQASRTVDEVKQRLGFNEDLRNKYVSARASQLRQQGINLRNMKRIGMAKKYNWENLAQYADWVARQVEELENPTPEQLSLETWKNQVDGAGPVRAGETVVAGGW